MAEKYRVKREVVIERVRKESGVNLHEPASVDDLVKGLGILETLKKQGLGENG